MNFYTSDLHVGYEDVIGLCNRPWTNVEEMNKGIVENFNSVLGKDDVLIIAGDVACYGYNPVKVLKEIKGKKVLIVGNHDKALLKHKSFRDCFVDIRENEILKDGNYKIFISHYPMAEWDGYYKGIYQFYAHTHNSDNVATALMQFLPTAINVGVDVNNFMPRTAAELIEGRIKNYKVPDISISELLNLTTFAKVDDRNGSRKLNVSQFIK